VVEQPTSEGSDEVSDEAFEGTDHAEEHADGDIEAHSFERPAEEPLSSGAIEEPPDVEEPLDSGANEEPPDVEAHGFHPAAGSI
jgi:hypothetical protein